MLSMLLFVAGVVLVQGVSSLPAPEWAFLLLGVAGVGMLVARRLRPLLALVCGAAWAAGFAALSLGERLAPELEGRDLVVQGRIVDLPRRDGHRVRFLFDVTEGRLGDAAVVLPPRLRLSWYRTRTRFAPGQRWRLRVRLRRPHGFLNPGGFDYEGWLFRQGIGATGYVRRWRGNRLLETGEGHAPLDRLRQHLGELLEARLQESPGARILPALVIGDRGRLTSRDWALFTRTGTNHLVAISGLHIAIVAGLAFLVGRWGWRLVPRLPLRFPAPLAGVVAALLAATLYAGLAGFSLPTRRALLMLAVMLGATALRRRGLSQRGLVLALFMVVLLEPAAVLSPGLWLSFGAVAAIFMVTAGRIPPLPRWRQWFGVQMAVTLALSPVLFFFFGRASVIAPLANFLAIPLFSFLLVPAALLAVVLLGVPLVGPPLLQGVARTLDWGMQGLAGLAHLPGAVWQVPALPGWVWLPAGLGVAMLLLWRGVPGRGLALVLLLPLVVTGPERMPPGGFRFTLLDVGQGLAAAVETRAHLLLFDTGPRFSRHFDAGEAVLLPWLRDRGWSRVDRLIVSHGDSDHSGGVSSLRAGVTVDSILAGEPERLAVPARPCEAGRHWRWDGVEFRILSPPQQAGLRDNDRSCVLLVRNDAGTLLLPGDIEKEAEARLLQEGVLPPVTVLVAPHHGSTTSSSPAFARALRPRWVLFATGYRNAHHFPRPQVVRRWHDLGARLLNTADSGAIRFDFGAHGGLDGPFLYREDHHRYWRDPAGVSP